MRGIFVSARPANWAIVIDLHDPETGKRRRKWHSFRGTKRRAQVECSKLSGDTYVSRADNIRSRVCEQCRKSSRLALCWAKEGCQVLFG
jgi:hypothetical protein